jgi:serine protease Do
MRRDWIDALTGIWLVLVLVAPSFSARADLADTIARIKPSIVMVGTYDRMGSPQFNLRGTGFVVGDGHTVATNAHVIDGVVSTSGPVSIVVQVSAALPDQRVRPAQVIAVDKTHDLALLKIEGPALPTLPLRDSDTAKEGQSVAFTGFPLGGVLGFTPVTHRASVSAITPIALPGSNAQQLNAATIRGLKNGAFNILQLDGTAYPGNSGGPLFDVETGDVVGVVNMVFIKHTKEAALSHPSGISYAIPSNYLRDLIANTK